MSESNLPKGIKDIQVDVEITAEEITSIAKIIEKEFQTIILQKLKSAGFKPSETDEINIGSAGYEELLDKTKEFSDKSTLTPFDVCGIQCTTLKSIKNGKQRTKSKKPIAKKK